MRRPQRFRGAAINWAVVAIVCLSAGLLLAADERSSLIPAEYSITAWGHKDGLPSTSLYALAQSKDGFLWLGTADGLVRFDGVQFVGWRPSQILGQVRSLCATDNGDLWAGTQTGMLARIRDEAVTTMTFDAPVVSIEPGRAGFVWVAGSRKVWHVEQQRLSSVGQPILLSGTLLSGPIEDENGTAWVTTTEGTFRIAPDGNIVRTGTEPAWIISRSGMPFAEIDFRNLKKFRMAREIGTKRNQSVLELEEIEAVIRDHNGDLWVATREGGVVKLQQAQLSGVGRQFTREDGLSSDFVRTIIEDREHNLWVATRIGLDRFRYNKAVTLGGREGLPVGGVNAIAPSDHGAMWLATHDGVERISGSSRNELLGGTHAYSILQDRKGMLWIGTSHGLVSWNAGRVVSTDAAFAHVEQLAEDERGVLWFYDSERGMFSLQPGSSPARSDALGGKTTEGMWSGGEGDVWFGLTNGQVVRERDGGFQWFGEKDGLRGGAVHFLSGDSEGTVWAATESGLCLFTGSRFQCVTDQNGLPGNRVQWAVADTSEDLWLGYNIGVVRVSKSDLLSAAAGDRATIQCKLYDDGDGIRSGPELHGGTPAAWAANGALWFTTADGIAMIDPAHLQINAEPPPVHIVEMQADGRDVGISGSIQLPPLTRSIEIRFTGLSFTDPRKVRFRYRLARFDSQWHDGGNHREATYTNLPPGNYRFEVAAANNDGVWNNTGAELRFVLLPAFYQTLWFRVLCATVVLLGAVILYRARLRAASHNLRVRYEERMEERTRIAQELHDHLLQEMVGISMQLEVADELTAAEAGAKKPLQRALDLSRSVIANGRRTLQALRDHSGQEDILQSLRKAAEIMPEERQNSVRYLVDGEQQAVRADIAAQVGQIGREALCNALKHAKGEVVVHLHFGYAALELTVRDWGGGISDAIVNNGKPGHFGLAGMRERAGRLGANLIIETADGQGTTVRLSVPASTAYEQKKGRRPVSA